MDTRPPHPLLRTAGTTEAAVEGQINSDDTLIGTEDNGKNPQNSDMDVHPMLPLGVRKTKLEGSPLRKVASDPTPTSSGIAAPIPSASHLPRQPQHGSTPPSRLPGFSKSSLAPSHASASMLPFPLGYASTNDRRSAGGSTGAFSLNETPALRPEEALQQPAQPPSLAGIMVEKLTGGCKPTVGADTTRGNAEKRDIGNWAAQNPEANAKPVRPSLINFRTSQPNMQIRQDLDIAARDLISEKTFATYISDAENRARFREALLPNGQSLLDLFWDTQAVTTQLQAVEEKAVTVHTLYHNIAQTYGQEQNGITECAITLRTLLRPDSAYLRSQAMLKTHLYDSYFAGYVRNKVIEHVRASFGAARGGKGLWGLGDAFVLTNPRLPDNPALLVTDAYLQVTGYSRDALLYKNCRLLQGPGTSEAATRRIRSAMAAHQGVSELLLNYTQAGVPFYNLLCIVPLFDAKGNLTYWLGGMTNVSGSLGGKKILEYLLGLDTPSARDEKAEASKPSPTLQKYEHRMAGHRVRLDEAGPNLRERHLLDASSAEAIRRASSKSLDAKSAASSRKSRRSSLLGDGRLGAEASLDPEPQPLQQQERTFRNLFTKLLVFAANDRREILFITPDLLRYLGLPIETDEQRYDHLLLHVDFLELFNNKEAKQIVKEKMRGQCEAFTLHRCELELSSRNFLLQKTQLLPKGTLQIYGSPLRDSSGWATAYVVVMQ